MSTLVLVGAQWGDEGKGKITDVIAAKAHVVARFAGGNNAGHTLVIDGTKVVTHLVPSGCMVPGTVCALGAGMVIDPEVFDEEVQGLRARGLLAGDELRVSLDAHVIFPYHRWLDGRREDAAAEGQAIGTTRRGIGPAYEAKAGRRGIRIRDLARPEKIRDVLAANKAALDPIFERLGAPERLDVDELGVAAGRWAKLFEPIACDVGGLIDSALGRGENVLLEGAQGALLDVDHGTYPFVTSTTTTAAGAPAGVGIGPTRIDAVWGITKAYATRVGAGPFPSRVEGDVADRLRAAGGEFGATTGRPRDCGWLDLPALAYAARVNGLTGLCVTKLDVLAAIPDAMVCTEYRDGLDPGRDGFEQAVPVLERIAGWDDPDLQAGVLAARSVGEMPAAARRYLDRISEAIGVPLTIVSVGPDRSQTISVVEPF